MISIQNFKFIIIIIYSIDSVSVLSMFKKKCNNIHRAFVLFCVLEHFFSLQNICGHLKEIKKCVSMKRKNFNQFYSKKKMRYCYVIWDLWFSCNFLSVLFCQRTNPSHCHDEVTYVIAYWISVDKCCQCKKNYICLIWQLYIYYMN